VIGYLVTAALTVASLIRATYMHDVPVCVFCVVILLVQGACIVDAYEDK
jgi:hypothetical protein